jgi:putative lipase involved disintegration of autophagic bodies
MSTIRLSSPYVNSIITTGASMASTVYDGTANTITGSTSGGPVTSLLIIYQGAIPTWATLTDRATRASDVLITFTLPPGAGNQWSYVGNVGQSARYIFGKCATPTAASASGAATWFILCRAGTTSMTDKGAMMGTVGDVGAGADLSIPSTSIVSGSNYQSAGFFVNMPQNWTV